MGHSLQHLWLCFMSQIEPGAVVAVSVARWRHCVSSFDGSWRRCWHLRRGDQRQTRLPRTHVRTIISGPTSLSYLSPHTEWFRSSAFCCCGSVDLEFAAFATQSWVSTLSSFNWRRTRYWRQNVLSALEKFFSMRYVNLRFTYLLTYLLTYTVSAVLQPPIISLKSSVTTETVSRLFITCTCTHLHAEYTVDHSHEISTFQHALDSRVYYASLHSHNTL